MMNSTLKNANILIVDDRQANIDVLTGLLELKGYTNIEQTTDSRLVINLFKESKPDLILLDLMMPYVNGFQILKQLKELIPASTYMPILVLSADVSPDSKQIALSDGASDFLSKPFDLIEVELRIKNLLKTRFFHQQLENQNQILEERVKERTIELEITNSELIVAKERAEQSDKLKSEFLAQMSHEIRTPLNAVLGYVEYISDLFGEPKNSEVVESFSGVNLASNRIIRTIDLILNAAELQTGNYQPSFQQIDLDKEILNKLYKKQLLIANQRGLELTYTGDLNNPNILADDYSTTQIFANLIDNAIIYTKKGKVEILLTKNINGNVVVEIKDAGIGIAEEFLPKLFNPFTQEEQVYSRSFDGNGLGLALVKNYCDINNAQIEVESVKNVGSTFRIIFDKKSEEYPKLALCV